MFEATVGGLRVNWQEPKVLLAGNLRIEDHPGTQKTIIDPADKIRIGVAGTVAGLLGQAPPGFRTIEIGFVQTLVRSARWAGYGSGPITRWFTQTHPFYPVKDGEGSPWYKPEHVWRVSPSGAMGRMQGGISFRVEVTDRPGFAFPTNLDTPEGGRLPVATAQAHDSFITCLLVRFDGDNSRCHFLHQVAWRFRFSAEFKFDKAAWHLEPGQALKKKVSIPIPAPHGKPPNVKIDGVSANSSRLQREDPVGPPPTLAPPPPPPS